MSNEDNKEDRAVDKRVKYDPAHCELVISMGQTGATMSQMASAIGIGKSTLRYWREKHEDFAQAVDKANTLAQAYMEQLAKENMANRQFNDRLWIRGMQARFEEYKDVKPEKTNNQPVNVTVDFGKAIDNLLNEIKSATK